LGITRYETECTIDLAYHPGAVHVVPAVGEQWFVKRFGANWMLDRKLPYNSDAQVNVVNNPVPGTYQLGSSGESAGPMYLMGSQVNVQAPLGVLAVSTTARPSAATVGAGGHIFDVTLGKPIWSNGTAWVDSSGATV
jgi:hypothetical protein